MTLPTANSLDGNSFVPGIFPNLNFAGTLNSNIFVILQEPGWSRELVLPYLKIGKQSF